MSTIASGVATAAGSTPKFPVRLGCTCVSAGGHLARHRDHPVGDVVEVDELLGRVRQRLVHDRDRADPAYRLLQRGPRPPGSCSRRACSRSSAATVCRLFFTRWWISRIVASLVISSRSRRRSSVTSRISTSAPIRAAADDQRDRPQLDDRAARLHLGLARRPAARTTISDSSIGSSRSHSAAVTSPSSAPTRSAARPSRR